MQQNSNRSATVRSRFSVARRGHRLPIALALASFALVAAPLSLTVAQQTPPAETPAPTPASTLPGTERREVKFAGASIWLDVPSTWRAITAEELKMLNSILPPEQANNKFIGGFASSQTMGYPYMLVQRIPARLRGNTAAQIAEGFNAVNLDEVRSGVKRGLGDLISNLSLEQPVLDLPRSRIVQTVSGQVPDGIGGSITFKGFNTSFLTNDAVIGVYQYEEASKFDAARAGLVAVVDGATFEPNVLYVPAAAQAGTPGAPAKNSDNLVLIVASLVGGGIGLLVVLRLVALKKKVTGR